MDDRSPKIYLALGAKSFQRLLAYRAANLSGIATNVFFGAIYIWIYLALFHSRTTVGGLDARDTVTYAVLSQSLLMVMSAFGNLDLSEAIVKGDIVSDLCRPVDFYGLWASIDLGRAAYYLLLRGIPTFAIGCLLFHPEGPAGMAHAVLTLLAITLGACLSFAYRFIANSLAFWTTDVRGVHYLTNSLVLFLSGFTVPLNFFPPGLRVIAELLPFQALAHLPINIYLGKLGAAQMAQAFALQIGWLVVLVLGGHWLLGRMVRRLSINGG